MEEDRAVRRTRLDRLLDQAARAGCDVPLAKMVLGMHHSPLSLCLSVSLSLGPIICVQLHCVK